MRFSARPHPHTAHAHAHAHPPPRTHNLMGWYAFTSVPPPPQLRHRMNPGGEQEAQPLSPSDHRVQKHSS